MEIYELIKNCKSDSSSFSTLNGNFAHLLCNNSVFEWSSATQMLLSSSFYIEYTYWRLRFIYEIESIHCMETNWIAKILFLRDTNRLGLLL